MSGTQVQCTTVPILDDEETEDTETFTLVLTTSLGGIPSLFLEATGIITDNDFNGKELPYTSYHSTMHVE